MASYRSFNSSGQIALPVSHRMKASPQPQLNTLADYESFAGKQSAGKAKYNSATGRWESNVAFRGGYLSPSDYSKATWMETKQLQDEQQTAQDEAKATNESRYTDILAKYGTRYNTAMSSLQGLGDQAKKDVGATYRRAGASANQSLINSGLHSTTIAPAVSNQIARQETDALGRVNESLRRERLGYQTGMSKEMLDFMERREDEYPNDNLYVQLMNQLGQGAN